MASQKRRVLWWLYRQSFSPGVVEFSEALREAARSALGMAPIAAEAFAQANDTRFWNYLLAQLDHDKRRGLTPIFAVADKSARRLRWVPHLLIESAEAPSRSRGVRFLSRPSILQVIDSLSHREYEALGCVVTELAGGNRTYLTPTGNEGGVDFYGLLNLPGRCHLFSGASGPLRVVGQAKQYAAAIGVDAVRDFMTSLDHVKKRHHTVEAHVPHWFRSAPGPVVGMIISHRGFQDGALQLSRDNGIVTATSEDLSEIASLARELGVHLTPPDRAQALRDRVEELLLAQAA